MAVDPNVLREVLTQSGLKFKQTSVSYVFDCVRCSGKQKLYIRKRDGRFVCWKCKETDNYQGKPEYALVDLLNLSLAEVKTALYGGSHVQVEVRLDLHLKDFFGDEDELDEDAVEVPKVDWPVSYYPIEAPESKKGARYMAGRGVPLALSRLYGLHYAPEKERVVFPIASGNELYGWQERLVVSTKWWDPEGRERERPKILSSTGIPRDRTLMFVDRLKGYEHAVLCEGPVDAIKAHACGGNVCTMGKAVSQQQMNLLLNGGVKKLYLALDPDAADEMQRLAYNHFDDVELYQMLAPEKGAEKSDLGAMDYSEVYDLFVGARRIEAGRLLFFLRPDLA